jgi:hypothetical protein
MKRALFAVLLSLLAGSLWAQSTANFALKLNVNSVDPNYQVCRVYGQNNDPYQTALPGRGRITSGGGVGFELQGVNAADDSFLYVRIGDIISVVDVNGERQLLYVEEVPDADNAWVSTSVDLSATGGHTWEFYHQDCVQDDSEVGFEDAGWISVTRNTTDPSGSTWMVTVQFDGGDASLLSAQIQCKTSGKGAEPVIVYPSVGDTCGQATLNGSWCDFDTIGIAQRLGVINVSNHWSSCRVALKLADDTEDIYPDDPSFEVVTVTVTER